MEFLVQSNYKEVGSFEIDKKLNCRAGSLPEKP